MAFTTPRTWTTGELVTAAFMNTHVRDNFSAGFPTDAVWDDWTPSLTNITVGNGTQVARYMQIGDTVHCFWSLTFGSGSSIAAGNSISLPVTAASTYHAEAPIGSAYLLEAAVSSYMARVVALTTTTARIQTASASGSFTTGSNLTNTSPFTWGTGDVLSFEATYEAA